MNIFNLLTKKKSIVGVEISDDAIRLTYFNSKKNINNKKLFLVEELIPENIITEGIIIDKKKFAKILKDIWITNKLKSSYAIVSIPEDKIYSHIYPFPKTDNEKQLKEAIKLAMDFELPIKKEIAYVGSENAGDSNVINEILISAIQKNIADDYIEVMNSVGIKILALESHLFSIARSIKSKFGQALLIYKTNLNGSTIFILKDRSLRFSRTISKKFIKDASFFVNEINHIKTWFESEKNISTLVLPLSEINARDDYSKYLEQNGISKENESKWLIALGATIRGEITEGKDNQISLLPIGTNEAYVYQKITTFIIIMRNIIIGVSIFFFLTFLVAYFFILSISPTNTNISTNLAPAEIPQKEIQIQNINSIISTSKEIISNTPNWSILINDLINRTINGISISSLSVTSITDKIYMVGVAINRDTLNQYKKSLQESSYLINVELPINNLGQKENIPFTISFNLKDPNMIYYK